MMTVRMDDNCPHQFWVSSETAGGEEYCVELAAYPLGLNEHGIPAFNGACGRTAARIRGCKDFIFRCEPKLKNPVNAGKTFRCKHCRAVREFALDLVVPYLVRADPNIPDEQQA
jgi:hypothetical protein